MCQLYSSHYIPQGEPGRGELSSIPHTKDNRIKKMKKKKKVEEFCMGGCSSSTTGPDNRKRLMEESHMPQKEQKEPCITLPNALEMPAKNKQENFISDQNCDLLGVTDCLGELKLNPEKYQPVLEE